MRLGSNSKFYNKYTTNRTSGVWAMGLSQNVDVGDRRWHVLWYSIFTAYFGNTCKQ